MKLLLNNRPISNLESVDIPKDFASGKTIDINAEELLGIGSVANYYNWMSEEARSGNTYQAVCWHRGCWEKPNRKSAFGWCLTEFMH